MNLALILSLITFLGWGTGDLFTIVATRRIGATLTTFWVFFFSFILSLLVFPFAPHNIQSITLPMLGFNLFLGVLFVSANVLISEAFRISSAPLVGIIIQGFPAVVLILSAIVFKDIITPLQWLFAAVVFMGVVLCSVNFKKLQRAEKIFDKGTVLALIAMVFLSTFFTFSRILIRAYDWFLPSFIATACFPVIYLFIRIRKEKFTIPKEPKMIIATFMVGLLIRAGDFSLNWGLSLPDASSIVAPIAGVAPILFVISSYFIFKDEVSKQQVLGIITTLVGIFRLALEVVSLS